jgi:hypothetical protein
MRAKKKKSSKGKMPQKKKFKLGEIKKIQLSDELIRLNLTPSIPDIREDVLFPALSSLGGLFVASF